VPKILVADPAVSVNCICSQYSYKARFFFFLLVCFSKGVIPGDGDSEQDVGDRCDLARDCIAATAACHGQRLLAAVQLPTSCLLLGIPTARAAGDTITLASYPAILLV
jgi:hypothetical protein